MLGYTWTTCNGTCIFKQALIFIKTLKYLSDLVWKRLEGPADRIPTTKLGRLESSEDVLESGCYQEVLLLQAELFARKELSTTKKSTQACTMYCTKTYLEHNICQRGIINTIHWSAQYFEIMKEGSIFMKVRHFNSLRGRYIMVLLVHVMYIDVN